MKSNACMAQLPGSALLGNLPICAGEGTSLQCGTGWQGNGRARDLNCSVYGQTAHECAIDTSGGCLEEAVRFINSVYKASFECGYRWGHSLETSDIKGRGGGGGLAQGRGRGGGHEATDT